MPRTLIFLIVFALGLAVIAAKKPAAAPAAMASSAASSATMEKELKDADREFAHQLAARGLDGWMDSFADDASAIHEGKTVTGKPALHAYYASIFADKNFSLTWSPTKAEVSKDGTLGYTYGDYQAKEGADISRGMYVTAWRRENGRWKVVLDLGSTAR
jgi:ketosteroid isomerase-like protein